MYSHTSYTHTDTKTIKSNANTIDNNNNDVCCFPSLSNTNSFEPSKISLKKKLYRKHSKKRKKPPGAPTISNNITASIRINENKRIHKNTNIKINKKTKNKASKQNYQQKKTINETYKSE